MTQKFNCIYSVRTSRAERAITQPNPWWAWIGALTLILILTGCASSQGFHRERLRAEANMRPITDNEEIAKAFAKRPQLPKPFRVAVHLQSAPNDSELRWKESDRELFRRLAEKLAPSNEISAIFPLAKALIRTEELADLRLAAADQGADALLVVSATADVARKSNNWSWMYLALITAFFVPGTTSEALVLTQASLWDVRNGLLYLSAESEHTETRTSPIAITDDHELIQKAKQLSLEKLSVELENQFQALIRSSNEKRAMNETPEINNNSVISDI